MSSDCSKCVGKKRINLSTKSSLLGGLLVVLIPKCPLCIMAYTGAITMCGGENMVLEGNNWLSFIPLALSALIVGLIAFNRKGTRTWFALFIALAATGLITATHQLWLPGQFYNYGTILLFFAIWLNSNYIHSLRYLKQKLAAA